MPLVAALQNYRDKIVEGNSYITLAHRLDASGNYEFPELIRFFITESAFLKMFIAWESFLEETFICYLMHEPSLTGKSITTYVNAIDESHAHKIIIGTNSYVDWANPEIVKKIASVYFENGEPYSTILRSINTDLLDLRTVRNSAAHLSSTTGHKLDALCSRYYSRHCVNMTSAKFLLDSNPNNTSQTILQSYFDLLDIAAENICNG